MRAKTPGCAPEKASGGTNPGRTVIDNGVQQNLVPALARFNQQQPGMVVARPFEGQQQMGLGPVIPQMPPPAVARSDDDEEVSLAEMVAQLRKVIDFFWPYRWLIAGLAALGFAGGGVSAFLAPPRVAAYFEVTLQSKASDNPWAKS